MYITSISPEFPPSVTSADSGTNDWRHTPCCSIIVTPIWQAKPHISRLVQERSNSSALAMELLLSWTKSNPSICKPLDTWSRIGTEKVIDYDLTDLISMCCLCVCVPQASYQIRKVAGCTCVGNAGNVFPTTDFKRNRYLVIPACIMARAWCTCRDAYRDR